MTGTAASAPGPVMHVGAAPSAEPHYVVRVSDAVDESLAGHRGVDYCSPELSREAALALVELLAGTRASPNGAAVWTLAVAGGRRTITLTAHGVTSPAASTDRSARPSALTHASRLPEFAGQQAVHDRVATTALERQMGAQDALAREPAALGDTLGRAIVGAARQRQPADAQILEGPASQ